MAEPSRKGRFGPREHGEVTPKILLDEMTTEEFIDLLSPHEVSSVVRMGWSGMVNGKLLTVAEESGFTVLITVDKRMQFQQNMQGRSLALVVLDIHPIAPVIQLMCLPKLVDLLDNVVGGNVYVIDGPHPKRDRSE